MPLSHQTLFALLSLLMSELTEQCFSASWLPETEYALWDAAQGRPLESRWADLTSEDITMLRELSEALGGWIVWQDERTNRLQRGMTAHRKFITTDEWLEVYAAHRETQNKHSGN